MDESPPITDLRRVKQDKISWHFLVNPAAGRGRAVRQWRRWEPRLRAALPDMAVHFSIAGEGLAALATRLIGEGATYLVGVGGDGTHHDIVNGIVAAKGLGRVTYAPLPLGTGNDWVRTLGTPRRVERWLTMLTTGRTVEHRVGRIVMAPPTVLAPASAPALVKSTTRYFINVAGLAYDAEVVQRSETARFKHRLLYPLLTLVYLKDFRPPTVRITYDGGVYEGSVHTVNLGIGRYNGGGMRLVPQADPCAATLALTYAEKLPLWRILASSWRFYTDTIGSVPGLTVTTATEVRVQVVSGNCATEADGEYLGTRDIRADLFEKTLRVVVP